MRNLLWTSLILCSLSSCYQATQSNFVQGNKSRLPHTWYNRIQDKSGQGYYGECDDLIVKWSKSWDSGLEAKILAKPKGAPAIDGWSVVVEFDKPVTKCVDYDAEMTKLSDTKYEARNKAWNSQVAQDAEKVVTLSVTWESGTSEPKPLRINIDGQGYQCKMGPEPDVGNEDLTSQQQEGPSTTTSAAAAAVPAVTTTARPPVQQVSAERGIFAKWPKKVMGLYVLLADDDHEGFRSEDCASDDCQPRLYPYQQKGANVLFFTFIHPTTMAIPPSFAKLAKTRGTDAEGAVPKDTVILFAIGGYAYSVKINPWPWLTTKEKAEAMAVEVAKWPEMYGCDGIDLDIEDGAGDASGAGANMIHFVAKLRELSPKMIISQPTYGYPAIDAEIELINESWDANGVSSGLADSIGLMVYEGTSSLNYVKNYVDGPGRWQGFPQTCRAPSDVIILGAKGQAGESTMNALVDAVIENDFLGIMVWYVSIPGGLQYAVSWDGSDEAYQQSFVKAMDRLRPFNK